MYPDQRVSVIIPIYNVEKYLRQSIDSVLSQTHSNLEIILVDDGSTDKSGQIVDEYAIIDNRIKVIHKTNGGLSDARNAGTNESTGDWIFYLDSDDYITSNAIETLLDFANTHQCDIVQGGFYYLYSDYLLYDKSYGNTDGCITNKHALELLFENKILKNFAWGKLYKSELAKRFRFPKGKYFEDSFWQYKMVDACKKYGIVKSAITYYRQRPDSISGTASVKILDLLEGKSEFYNYLVTNYPELSTMALKRLWSDYFQICYYNRGIEGFDKMLETFIADNRKGLDNILARDIKYQSYLRGQCKKIALYDFILKVRNRLFGKSAIVRCPIDDTEYSSMNNDINALK